MNLENNPRLADINIILVPGYIACDRGGGVWSFYKSKIIKFAYETIIYKTGYKGEDSSLQKKKKKTVKILDIGKFFFLCC